MGLPGIKGGMVMRLLTAALLLLFLGERVGLVLKARREGCNSFWFHAFAGALAILVLVGMK